MNHPLVSVVLCTYNGDRFVAEQLESICRQNYPHLEIIIVDDSSTDGTFELLTQYAQKDQRIRLYHNEKNLGFNLNFNRACSLAKGDFIAIADQDDIWHESKIDILLAKLQEDPDTILVHCISVRFEKFGDFHEKSLKMVNYHSGKCVRNFFLSNFISGHNMLLKKALLDKALPFPGNVYYDWWLAAIASCNGKIEAVPQVLVWHRMHNMNATGAAKKEIPLYMQVMDILPTLMTIPEMKAADRGFAARLLTHYGVFPATKFSFTLFTLLLRHARSVFSHKKRAFPWISYLKHSFKSAWSTTHV